MTTTPSSAPSDDDRLRILYGDPALAPPERTPLRAGPLTLIYTDLGDLRYIRYGRHEIVRRLYHAVRNETWGTVIPEITVVEREIGEDSFRIVYDSRHTDSERGIDLQARVTLTGDSDGTIVYDFDGEALSTFRRNRIGICVLHPAQDCKARMLHVKHTDASVEKGAFPDTISPHQPFFDIAELAHEIGDTGAQVTLTFAGDVFEMEDQRNWLDASYKTYSTPLALPMPVEVPAGTRIHQTVTLTFAKVTDVPIPSGDEPLVVSLMSNYGGDLPGIGFWAPQGADVPSSLAAELLKAGSHLLIEFDPLASPTTLEELDRPGFQQLVLLRNPAHIQPDTPHIAEPIGFYFEGASTEEILRAEAILIKTDSSAELHVYGYRSNFTELNRDSERILYLEAGEGNDYFGYGYRHFFGANPQVHAFDGLSIMETPPMLGEALRTARTFGTPAQWEHQEVLVGPLTLYGRHQPDDPRQRSLFGAAWYLAAIAYATSDFRLTLCEPVGPRGIMAADGTPYPLFHLLSALRPWHHCTRRAMEVRDPYSIACFCVRGLRQPLFHTAPEATFVVNLSPDTRAVILRGLSTPLTTIRILDETNAPQGFSERSTVEAPGGEVSLTLRPYAIAEIVTLPEKVEGEDSDV